MTTPAPLTPVERTYAIGDVHGCRIQFEAILGAIETHAAGRSHRIITCGDYCDRGPDSKGVYDILMSRPDIVALMGNHERMMLMAADPANGRSEVSLWTGNGGMSTLVSFGLIDPMDVPLDYDQWKLRLHQWGDACRALPRPYLDWISRLTLYVEDAHRVFVHAGLQPGISDMARQSEDTLLWIRDAFLRHTEPFHKYVVHGHTPQTSGQPQILRNRINLDTCCFHTGVLTCAVFDDQQPTAIGLIRADGAGNVLGSGDAN